MVVACTALVVALGGTAIAATKITSSNQITNGIITSADLKNGRAVNTNDLTPAARAALQGRLGPAGAPGASGPAGPAGAAGPQGEQGAKGDKGDTGTPDTSDFYNKADSDGRFINNAEQAADSAALGGLGAGGFFSGIVNNNTPNALAGAVNKVAFGRPQIPTGQTDFVVTGIDGIAEVRADCANNPADAVVEFFNDAGGSQFRLYIDDGGGTVTSTTVANGNTGNVLTVPASSSAWRPSTPSAAPTSGTPDADVITIGDRRHQCDGPTATSAPT